MKYCIRVYAREPEYVTKDEFWRLVFQQCMFGSQENIDIMEHCLYLGQSFIGSKYMFTFEDIDPSDANRAKEWFDNRYKIEETIHKTDPQSIKTWQEWDMWVKIEKKKKAERDKTNNN